ncbi:MAG: aspartate kinase [Planctomycetota bacterium]
MNAPTLTVVKVGGGLLGDAAGLTRVAAALAQRRARGERLLVVVSALRGVTDALEQAALLALDPRSGHEMVRDAMERLQRQHEAACAALPDAEAVRFRLRPLLDGAERLLTGIRLTGELTPRSRDLVMAHGERLAAPLVAAAVLAAGADARAVTAEEAGIVAMGGYRVASCDLPATTERLAALQHELHDRVLVLTGFYGINTDGDVLLFGRGGSDYTAGVAAACLNAQGLELWKDVPGFMTADPREVPSARLLPELSFDEACELGLYGARILHPRCLDPLRGLPVAVSVRCIEDVDAPGTRLVERPAAALGRPGGGQRSGGAVAALAARRGVAVVRVEDAAMINEPGVAGRILSAVGAAGVNVDAVSSSMASLSFSIDRTDAALVRRTLKLMPGPGGESAHVSVHEPLALLGIVGDGVTGDPAILGRVLGCLGRLGVESRLLSHGPGDVGLSCALAEGDLARALTALHAEFFGEPVPARPAARASRERG